MINDIVKMTGELHEFSNIGEREKNLSRYELKE